MNELLDGLVVWADLTASAIVIGIIIAVFAYFKITELQKRVAALENNAKKKTKIKKTSVYL